MTDTKLSGIALMAGVVLTIVLFPFVPGVGVGNVDILNFYDLTEAMQDAGLWTYISSLLATAALLLFIYGFIGLWRHSEGEVNDTLVRWGTVSVFIFLVFLLAAKGMDFVIMHVVDHGVGRGTEGAEAAALEATAVTLQSVKFGLRFIAAALGPIGFFLMSLSMVRGTMDLPVHKVFPIIMLIAAPVGLIAGILIEYDHDFLDAVLPVVSVSVGLNFLFPAVLGWGLYRVEGGAVREGAPVS